MSGLPERTEALIKNILENMKKVAFITGITGQDGSYLAEFLLHKNYTVHGMLRRSSSFSTKRIDHLLGNRDFQLHFGDLSDAGRLSSLLKKIHPNEIYNLAAQSHVRVSFDESTYTGDITGIGVSKLLESARLIVPDSRIYQASSSEMFGSTPPPQNEITVFSPQSPYAAAKLYGFWLGKIFQNSYNMFISNGILFNHESIRRGSTFVTKKIVEASVQIKNGSQDRLILGNLDAIRDWGYAPEYVESMWLILQQDSPSDYVISTGIGTSVEQFLDYCFSYVNLDWKNHVQIDPKYFRPLEVNSLIGDSSKARKQLGWNSSVDAKKLAEIMMEQELMKYHDKTYIDNFNWRY